LLDLFKENISSSKDKINQVGDIFLKT